MGRFDWVIATVKLNWANMTSNMGVFWSLSAMMAIQNLIYFSLWGVVFSRISTLHGWGFSEIAFLYACGGLGYGLLFTVFGGVSQISSYIHDGLLDIYLARPRPLLPSLLMHRMRADSLGDVFSSVLMIALFVKPDWADIPVIIALSILAGVVYGAFRLIMHTLAFWGLDNEAGENGFIAFLIAATNPQHGFGFWGKFILLTVFPAGYVGLLPVEILKDFDWWLFLWQIAGSCAVLAFSLWFFYYGLKRYTSGNKFLSLR